MQQPHHASDGHHPALHRMTAHWPARAGLLVLTGLFLALVAAPLMEGGVSREGGRLVIGPVVAGLLQGRGSLSFALLAGALGAALGAGWAVLALTLGPREGRALRTLAERLAAAPLPLVVLAAMGLLRPGVWLFALTVALAIAPAVAVAAHEGLGTLLRREFLTAARAGGVPERTVAARHLLPNAIWPLAAAGWPALPRALAIECFASLLGLGVPRPVGSWGTAIARAVAEADPLAAAVPALLLAVTLAALWAVADGIRAAGDPG